jgi:hypothetical protein
VSSSFKVEGRILRWNVVCYIGDKSLGKTNHVYRFKFLAQADADHFNKIERTREKEMNLDYWE